jgi:hypothetical protein
MPAGSEKCTYLESFEARFSPEIRRVAYIFMDGIILCPVCSTRGNIVTHKLEYPEVIENEHEKVV